MTADELRALAARIIADRRQAATSPAVSAPAVEVDAPHPSHAVYVSIVNIDGACVIEPGVPCNHCNYCRSHGH